MPQITGKYSIEAELSGVDDNFPVRSYREFQIISTSRLGIAYNKPATSSSIYTGLPASQAVDGDWTTRWSSLFADPQWIEIDLGSIYNIDSVKLFWETAYGRDYMIQTSIDGTAWTNIQTVSNNTEIINDLTGLSGSGRYIRMLGTARGTIWGYSLWEFLVFGTSISTDFKASSTSVNMNQTVTFTDLSLNNPLTWNWTFDGGIPPNSAKQNPSVTYNTPGIYDVTLTVETSNGSNEEIKYNYINVAQSNLVINRMSIPVVIYSYRKEVLINAEEELHAKVFIYNLTGRLIVGEEIKGGSNSIQMNESGIYLVKVTFNNNELIRKISIE